MYGFVSQLSGGIQWSYICLWAGWLLVIPSNDIYFHDRLGLVRHSPSLVVLRSILIEESFPELSLTCSHSFKRWTSVSSISCCTCINYHTCILTYNCIYTCFCSFTHSNLLFVRP